MDQRFNLAGIGLWGSTHVIHLAGRSAADGVSDTDTVDANLVDGTVEREQIDEVGAERILAGDWICFVSASLAK